MLAMFKEARAKCSCIMKQLRMDETPLEYAKSIEKLFDIDLNLLGYDYLRERKNKLMEGTRRVTQRSTTSCGWSRPSL